MYLNLMLRCATIIVHFIWSIASVQCESNGAGEVNAQIFDRASGNVTVVAGQTATIACTMDGMGTYEVVWKRFDNNNALFAWRVGQQVMSERPGVSVDFDQENSAWLLRISEVTIEDQGYYMCYVNTSPIIYQGGFLHVVPSSSEVTARGSKLFLVMLALACFSST